MAPRRKSSGGAYAGAPLDDETVDVGPSYADDDVEPAAAAAEDDDQGDEAGQAAADQADQADQVGEASTPADIARARVKRNAERVRRARPARK